MFAQTIKLIILIYNFSKTKNVEILLYLMKVIRVQRPLI